MHVEAMMERLAKAGIEAEIIGDGHNSELFVGGKAVGSIVDDMVTLYR